MRNMTAEQAHAVLVFLEYLSDLFTATPREQFSRIDVLAILNNVRDDGDLIDPAAVIEYEKMKEERADETLAYFDDLDLEDRADEPFE